MNIELMRFVDYWVGIPLCFLLSLSAGLGKANSKKPRKAAFVKLSEMGAIILAYPFLSAVKKGLPDGEMFFVTFQRNKDIFQLLPGMVKDKNIFTIRDNAGFSAFIADTFQVIRRLRREKIDIIFDLEFFSRFTAILVYLSGAVKRIGFFRYNYEGLYRGNLFTHRVQYNPHLHISKTYLSLWQVMKEEKEKISPDLGEKIEDKDIILPQVVPGEKESVEIKNILNESGVAAGSRLFLLNPGEGLLPLREWPLENFISLSKKILEDNRNYILLTGTKEAAKKAESLLKAVNNQRCVNLVNKTQISQLPALFAVSEALIANDCGLAHIASLSPIKKIIIFGPESPRVFGPLGMNTCVFYSELACSPCLSAFNHRKSSCKDSKCLKEITWESVYSFIK